MIKLCTIVLNYFKIAETMSTNMTLSEDHLYRNLTASERGHPWWSYGDNSRIEIPYAICALINLMMVPVYCYYQWSKPPPSFKPKHKEKQSWRQVNNRNFHKLNANDVNYKKRKIRFKMCSNNDCSNLDF